MTLFKEAATLTRYLQKLKKDGSQIGFAPTMGALHDGHIALIKKSKSLNDITVSSIFVNPTQFNDYTDYEKYPVTVGNDILLLENAGCDILFLPSVKEVYPMRTGITTKYDLGNIEFLLEGKYRPGHFQGVCQVVHRLLDVVKPDHLYMGQKDYQQCMIVKRLVQLINLHVEVIVVSTSRETSGLAMSSRNLRLNERQKQEASGISKMLQYIKDNQANTSFYDIEKYAVKYLLENGFRKVDYVSIADGESLQQVTCATKGRKLVGLIAAFIGDVRLIDNVVFQD